MTGTRFLKRRREFPGATPYRDRHGVRRWRFRAKGFSAELGTDYGSDEFVRRYEAAQQRTRITRGVGTGRTRPGSLSAVVASWKASPTVKAWEPLTKRTYISVAERLREAHGTKSIAAIETRHVAALMAEKADHPTAANRIRKVLGMLLGHAIEIGLRKDNPARAARTYKVKGDGYHTWTEDEIARFYEVHPIETIEHTAMTLMLFTGAARVDAVALGWANVRNGRILYRRQKTRNHNADPIDIPIHANLAEMLASLPRDTFTFLQTKGCRSRSPNGLGNLMREACNKAGLPHCTSHGLRKACARRLAEAGATPHEIAAVTGHKTLAEVERYTRAYDRSSLADSGFDKLAEWSKGEQKLANHPARFAKPEEKPS